MESNDNYSLDDNENETPQERGLALPPNPNAHIVMPNKEIGRPTIYTEQIGKYICERISTTTLGMRAICAEMGLPYSTYKQWRQENKEFAALYHVAKALQMDELVEQALDISDEDVAPGDMAGANMKKLRVETRLKIASKLAPKVYGDLKETEPVKIDINHNVDKAGFEKLIEIAKSSVSEQLTPLNMNDDGEDEDAEYHDYIEIPR